MAERINDELDGLIQDTRDFVQSREVPEFTPAVMRQVEQLAIAPGPAPIRRFLDSLWASREVSFVVRPAYGLAAVVLIAAGAVALVSRTPEPVSSTAVASTSVSNAPRVFVQFRLEASDASDVRLAGTFTNWQPQYELRPTASGVWTITIPLMPGVHDYAFIVDGNRWVPDPDAQAVEDGFGGTNSRISLIAPEDSIL